VASDFLVRLLSSKKNLQRIYLKTKRNKHFIYIFEKAFKSKFQKSVKWVSDFLVRLLSDKGSVDRIHIRRKKIATTKKILNLRTRRQDTCLLC